MAFTTQTFLFVVFPVFMLIQGLVVLKPIRNLGRVADLALLGCNLCFYAWACFDDVLRLLVYVTMIYVFGLWLGNSQKKGLKLTLTGEKQGVAKDIPISTLLLVPMAAMIIWILIHFRYTGLLASIWNFLFRDSLEGKQILAPLGISFITFSAISYLGDIQKGKAAPGDWLDCALYLTFFPKVVSGPIVLWRDFAPQIRQRNVTLDGVAQGVSRIMIGFAKKLILADTFGSCIASVGRAMDRPTVWGLSLLYMFQIYYDFSGYSDIAIGLSRLLGFSVKENFQFPYLSCSITEFWRRWHISLGTWFREYVYFPLGGSRRGKTRTLVNVGIVFFLTGVWHGAGWSYMLWGTINGVCNMVEKVISDRKWYQKIPRLVKWFVTMVITFFCWQVFRFEDLGQCLEWFRVMFGLTTFETLSYTWQYYFDTRMVFLMLVAMLGCTVLGLPKVQNLGQRIYASKWGYGICQVGLLVLFGISVLFMVNSTYSPFIYFQY